MTYKTYFNIIFLLASVHGYSQDQLNPDRPGEGKSPELVKGNNLQLEMGFRERKDQRITNTSTSIRRQHCVTDFSMH